MYTFDKSKRLLDKSDYSRVFEAAKKISTPDFILLYIKNNLANSRLGLAISKKVLAKAHERNRIKRIVRESFRHADIASYDVVVLAKKGIQQHSNHEIFKHLSGLWAKLNA